MKNRLVIIDSLEATRKAQGLTQGELAERAGTSRVTIGRVESGFDPKLATVHEMARALGLELMLVPKALAGEVQAFIQSGGRVLGQPSGAGAPDSVVATAFVLSQAARKLTREAETQLQSAHSAMSLARQVSDRIAGVQTIPQQPVWSARSAAESGLPAPQAGAGYPARPSTSPPGGAAAFPSKEGSRAPGISPAALARLQGNTPPKGGNR